MKRMFIRRHGALPVELGSIVPLAIMLRQYTILKAPLLSLCSHLEKTPLNPACRPKRINT